MLDEKSEQLKSDFELVKAIESLSEKVTDLERHLKAAELYDELCRSFGMANIKNDTFSEAFRVME